MNVILIIGSAIWLFEAACIAYLLILLLCSILQKLRHSRAKSPSLGMKFCIVVPAHNEALLIGQVVDGLLKQDYPADRFGVAVIADNCSDQTAEIVRSRSADVMERNDSTKRGKGWALDWAMPFLLNDPRRFDAFVVVDADSVLSPDFLQIMCGEMESGHKVVQGYYTVSNVNESWRTKLMTVALAMAHYVKPMGRNLLGLSDGLKGNGMCFRREAMELVPWSGESITEDIEHTLRLVKAGIRVHFSPSAVVTAQMPVDGKQAVSQRQRWEGGRYGLFKRAVQGLGKALLTGKLIEADRSIELIIPPFAELIAVPVIMGCFGALAHWLAPNSWAATVWLNAWISLVVAQVIYLACGLAIARVPFSIASSLLFAPIYIVWKLGVYVHLILKRGTGGWVRTERRTL